MADRNKMLAALAGGALLLGGAAGTPADAAPAKGAACDRACLRSTLDRYMDAVFKHDPAAAPMSAKARTTINAVEAKSGEGIWKTATGYGAIQRRFIDPKSGQAVYFGHLKEGDLDDIVAVRIKVLGRKITEAEWTVARKSDGSMFSDTGLAEVPPFPDRPLPASERAPRAKMIAAADSYFQGLQDHDGSKIPHVNGCERVENGFKVTNRLRSAPMPGIPGTTPAAAPAAPAGPTPGIAEESRSGDCASGLEGFAKSIANTSPRRFPVVDEEQGVVVGATILHRPPGVTTKRNLLTEVFYTREGKIAGIWAAMYYLDPAAPDSPGW